MNSVSRISGEAQTGSHVLRTRLSIEEQVAERQAQSEAAPAESPAGRAGTVPWGCRLGFQKLCLCRGTAVTTARPNPGAIRKAVSEFSTTHALRLERALGNSDGLLQNALVSDDESQVKTGQM